MPTVLSALRALDDGRHRAELYRMWASGHDAGLAHPRVLEMMGPRETAPAERVRTWLLNGTRRGVSPGDIVRAPDAPFEDFERALLALGDESGSLDQALRLLGEMASNHDRPDVAAAEAHYEPGVFTTFIAFEWTSAPEAETCTATSFSVTMPIKRARSSPTRP